MLTVAFANTSYTISEFDGILHVLFVLSNPSPFVETVEVATSDLGLVFRATENVDYRPGPYYAEFPNGSTSASFSMLIRDDDEVENDEQFFLIISSITNGHMIGYPRQVEVTIIDTASKTYFDVPKFRKVVVMRVTIPIIFSFYVHYAQLMLTVLLESFIHLLLQ